MKKFIIAAQCKKLNYLWSFSHQSGNIRLLHKLTTYICFFFNYGYYLIIIHFYKLTARFWKKEKYYVFVVVYFILNIHCGIKTSYTCFLPLCLWLYTNSNCFFFWFPKNIYFKLILNVYKQILIEFFISKFLSKLNTFLFDNRGKKQNNWVYICSKK